MSATEEAAIERQVEERGGDESGGRLAIFLARLLFIAIPVAAWEFLSVHLDAHYYVSRPSDIWDRLVEWTLTGYAFRHLLFTLQETVFGFALGAGAGILLGLILGLIPFLARALDPVIIGLYSLPKVALAPLFIVWFGIGMTMKVALSAISVFFLVLFNTLSGVRDVDRELIDVIRLMKGNRWQILTEVVLPSALVWVFSGLRISVPYAMIGAVTGEIITSNRGLGYLVSRSAGELDTTGVFAALVILVMVSLVLHAIVVRAENRVLHWRNAGR